MLNYKPFEGTQEINILEVYMKQILILLQAILLFSLISCKSSTTSEPEGNLKVSGSIIIDGNPVDSAIVQIDQVFNWKTTTNSAGKFQVQGVTKGTHTFQALKKSDNGEVVSQTTDIVVGNEDLTLGEIQLPKPSKLYPLDSLSVSTNGIHLTWSKSDDLDFREYKVFRKTDAGLDENTGELIFVSTSNSDTQFVDNSFSSGLTYYYRVFILSAYGKLGGSNLVNIKTPPQNYIVNGDFEESSDLSFPDNWTYHPSDNQQQYLSISTVEKYTGNRSLHLSVFDTSSDYYGIHTAWMNQNIETVALPKNIKYKFSFWAKSNIGKPIVYLVFSDDSRKDFEIPSGGGWQQYSTTFTLAENVTNIKVYIAAFGEFRENYRIEGWVDRMDLSLVQ